MAAWWALLFGVAAALNQDSVFPIHANDFTISRIPMSGQPGPLSPLKVTDHVVSLRRGSQRSSPSSMYVQAMRKPGHALRGASRITTSEEQLLAVESGQVFLASVTVGGQEFEVVVDSGSSDPWLVTPNFTCVKVSTGEEQDPSLCYFGQPYNASASSTYTVIPDQNFNISYADKEMLNGDMAYEQFTLGGITVPKQKFGLVDYAAWSGDGYSSGLIGFAYGSLTSAYSGNDPTKDSRGATLMYNPLFVNMYNSSLIAPVFSLVIDRDPKNGGLLALGGIPDVPHAPYWVNTPIISVGVFIETNLPAYEFYMVSADGFAFSSSPSTQYNVLGTNNPYKTPVIKPDNAIIDSGTSLVYAPNEVAEGVALSFNPQGYLDEDSGAWIVDCNALPPVFGVSIGEKIFFVNQLDMIVPSVPGVCISGVQNAYDGPTILGDVWMKNVISVFDVGASMMRFAAREFYGSTASPLLVTT